MSVRSFRPVMSVATCAFAALGCYLVSLRVAAERAGLEEVENRIVLAQRDIRTLQTEIGTRGRLEQLERWNVKVLALSAPKADQFVEGSYQLARLARPSDKVNMTAPVVMASVAKPAPAVSGRDDDADVAATTVSAAPNEAPAVSPASMMHVASYHVRTTTDPDIRKPQQKAVRKSAARTAETIKSLKIATTTNFRLLPTSKHGGKASLEPSRTGTAREKATH